MVFYVYVRGSRAHTTTRIKKNYNNPANAEIKLILRMNVKKKKCETILGICYNIHTKRTERIFLLFYS